MGRPEGAVEDTLRQLVQAKSGMCLKFVSGITGVPDRIVVLNGHTVFVELKAPGGKPRPLQTARIAQLRAAGAQVHVVDTEEGAAALVSDLMTAGEYQRRR